MNRLPFVMPEFTRVQWVSSELKSVWEPRISRIVNAWEKVERERESALQFISFQRLPELAMEVSAKGKVVVPLVYKNDGAHRVAICSPKNVELWIHFWKNSDWISIGGMLGYPPCCINFFQKVWVEEKYIDTTWEMSFNTAVRPYMTEPEEKYRKLNTTIIKGHPPRVNILLRWLGVRLVSHLPCRFNCDDSLDIAIENARRFEDLGYTEELKWVDELLRLPTEWKALHGIAEITTPFFRISANTDPTGESYSVKLDGVVPDLPKELDTWTDNGFKDLESMKVAHDDLIFMAYHHLSSEGSKVLDLGCGNGMLLSHFFNCNVYGVDFSQTKIKKAQELNPNGIFHTSSIYDFKWLDGTEYDLVMISANRLYENPLAETMVRKLKKVCKTLLLYTYDGKDLENVHRQFFYDWKLIEGSWRTRVIQP